MSLIDDLYAGERRAVLVGSEGILAPNPDLSQCILLAGSFNPLHEGHLRLLATAAAISDRRGIFEISIENVDKPDLPRKELERRLKQFKAKADVVITRARLFSDKAALLPGAWFVVGYDTAVRLLDDRYHSEGDAASDMRKMKAAGVRFVVAGRADSQGEFKGLESMSIPQDLKEMFIPVPESEFRADISSTELRKRQSG